MYNPGHHKAIEVPKGALSAAILGVNMVLNALCKKRVVKDQVERQPGVALRGLADGERGDLSYLVRGGRGVDAHEESVMM